MYNNPYFNQQANVDRINSQIAELERIKSQMNTQPMQPITQNFQIAPSNQVNMKYANTIDDVKKEIVVNDTPFFSKDLSVMWLKTNKGDIKSYELNEIIPRDEKDIEIEYLKSQINELKGIIKNAKSNNEYADDTTENEEPTNVSVSKSSTKKSK